MSDPSVPQKPPFEETEAYQEISSLYDEGLATIQQQLQSYIDEPLPFSFINWELYKTAAIESTRAAKKAALKRLRKAYDRGEL